MFSIAGFNKACLLGFALLATLGGCEGANYSSVDDEIVEQEVPKIHYIESALSDLGAINYADLDLDGDIDLLAESQEGSLYWYRNNGEAGFSEALIASNLYSPYDIDVVDFDRDGSLDIVTFDSDKNIVLLSSRWAEHGDIVHKKVMETNVGCYFSCELEVADFNNDDVLDLLYCNASDCHLVVFKDAGQTDYDVHSLGVINYATNITAEDINGDGWIDFSYAAFSQQTVVVRKNLREVGKFSNYGVYVDHAYGAAAVQDINKDGIEDVVGTRSVFIGQGNNNYSEYLRFSYRQLESGVQVDYYASSFLVIDLDGDGDNDIVSTNAGGGYYFFENGVGSEGGSLPGFSFDAEGAIGLMQLQRDPNHGTARPIRIVDLDNDGRLDIIANQLVDGKIMWGDIQYLAENSFIDNSEPIE